MASPSLDGMYLPGNEVDEGNYALYGNEADGLAVPMPSDERPIKENRDASEGMVAIIDTIVLPVVCTDSLTSLFKFRP